MGKKEYSAELTKMLHQLKTNKGAPMASLRRFKDLSVAERKIYSKASEKFVEKQKKLLAEKFPGLGNLTED